ncbi:hypothetical protein AB0I53_04980 [Saccharopolyspora sp. NPDC050389]|uniref:hypothetical protein n=1 Tax=Saccharopolyspora sp. NPDC050389 TaxID=3155516 RepID=UPI0033E5DFCF
MTTEVRCRAVDGTPRTLRLEVIGDAGVSGGGLPTRVVSVDGGPRLLQKWVPRNESGDPGRLRPLDREIRALHRFALTFPHDGYPPELPRLWYYDVDGDEPFVLVEPYRGKPVEGLLPELGAQHRYRLQVGLLRALHLAAVAGMTHGRVDLEALRWDSETRTVQLVDFERAAGIGEQRGSADGRCVDVRDDVWDAGLTLWRTVHPHTGRGAPDLTVDGGALSTLLDGVFVNPPEVRPTPADLLTRLREPTDVPVLMPGSALVPGVEAYKNLLRRKREQAAAQAAQDAPSRSWLPWRRASKSEVDHQPVLVRCPVCLDSYPRPLPDDELWRHEDGEFVKDDSSSLDPQKRQFRNLSGYRRCPNPSDDADEHFLPATYYDHGPPLVVALIGRPSAGKTHLLAAMLREVVDRGGLTPYGLTATALDLHRHDRYRRQTLEPAERGERLPGTPEGLTDPAEILLISGPGGSRPLVFFDVAGEDLQAVGDSRLARFLIGTGALIFAHGLEPAPERVGNQAFEMSLARLRAVPDFERLPAAVVATKSDRLRYLPPIDHWLRHRNGAMAAVDPVLLHMESSSVFAFLHGRGDHAALAPFSVFDRCTLHFVSASGSEAVPGEERFPRGFEPVRVLEPLVAVLAMAGMIEGTPAGRVGT